MNGRKRRIKIRRIKIRSKRNRRILLLAVLFGSLLIGGSTLGALRVIKEIRLEKPTELLVRYMNDILEEKYDSMYEMLDTEQSEKISMEEFKKRNAGIYQGIEVRNMMIEVTAYDKEQQEVSYHTSFDTAAGKISFDNQARFVKRKDGYKLIWHDDLIFPHLEAGDKVRVTTTAARRGEILDRNDHVLAGKGTASMVGVVPGKLENREQTIDTLADLLMVTPDSIERKLAAKWVKEDSFVPIKMIPKLNELAVKSPIPEDSVLEEQALQEQLLDVPGVMITDTEVREYPLGKAAAHLVGYVQNVTAEDLEKHHGEGYSANSVIGRSGMEGLYEKELKGEDGCCIYIVDEGGNKKEELANELVQNGKDIKLTIDASLQRALYDQFWQDKSCSVAMNPDTGEVLALVSTPSFDDNDFILGMSAEKWESLNKDESKPLYNRFRQKWCPGSSFKPVIAAIGLKTGAIDPDEDFGNVGLRWQKDESWGTYEITTLHAYEPVILKNALIYSDNIYFAKAALKIGGTRLKEELCNLGFDESLPFEITMAASQYSNTGEIGTEIQLADSGYGQGQVLINPLHLATIYTSFCNKGSMIKPYLLFQEEPKTEIWIADAFPEKVAEEVREGMKEVVNNPHGTGYAAHMDDTLLAGKTGTAEIKASKTDTTGTELGWFAVFTAEPAQENPILLISMVEDVKDIGGSGYVVRKDKSVLEEYLHR
ncbi:MAG: penicillin-binding transpeptidase domain-containing protein [Lachnospiraceae bacterium]|nr:penicillin-binding transpeptidase domain-containing protein [Lachnospiraceae bacterium]